MSNSITPVEGDEALLEAMARAIVQEHGEHADTPVSRWNGVMDHGGFWKLEGPLWKVEGLPLATVALAAYRRAPQPEPVRRVTVEMMRSARGAWFTDSTEVGPDRFIADYLNAALSTQPVAADEVERLRKEVERLRMMLKPTLFWDHNHPECGHSSPWDIVDESGWHNGKTEISGVREGVELGVRYYAKMIAAEDADSDDDIEVVADTFEAAQAIIDAEMARRETLAAFSPTSKTESAS